MSKEKHAGGGKERTQTTGRKGSGKKKQVSYCANQGPQPRGQEKMLDAGSQLFFEVEGRKKFNSTRTRNRTMSTTALCQKERKKEPHQKKEGKGSKTTKISSADSA